MHDRDRDWQVETVGITGLTKILVGIAGLKNPIGNPLELYSVKLQTNLFTRKYTVKLTDNMNNKACTQLLILLCDVILGVMSRRRLIPENNGVITPSLLGWVVHYTGP